jgi:hypothetical protein
VASARSLQNSAAPRARARLYTQAPRRPQASGHECAAQRFFCWRRWPRPRPPWAVPTVQHFPGRSGRGRQHSTNSEPFDVKTRSPIGIAWPIQFMPKVSTALQENAAQTCNEHNQPFHDIVTDPDRKFGWESQSRPRTNPTNARCRKHQFESLLFLLIFRLLATHELSLRESPVNPGATLHRIRRCARRS